LQRELLTFMSIRDQIRECVGVGRLFWLPPLAEPLGRPRTVFASPDVYAVAQQWETNVRFASLRGSLDQFSRTMDITFALDPFNKEPGAFMARTDPPASRIVSLRVFDSEDGIRVLGSFSEQDVFIALTWHFRESIPEGGWPPLVHHCRARWDALFSQPPRYGNSIHAYVSERVSAA
jgi:hypothetical protein